MCPFDSQLRGDRRVDAEVDHHCEGQVRERQHREERGEAQRAHFVDEGERQHEKEPQQAKALGPVEPGHGALDGRHLGQRLEDVAQRDRVRRRRAEDDQKDGDDEDKDEAVEMPTETPAEPVMAGEAAHKDAKDMKKEAMHKDKKDMKKEAMHGKDKDKKKMDEYKIQKSADNADHADSKASPVKTGGAKMGGTPVKTGSGPEDKGRPAPTAQKMGDFENTPGKDKGTSMKKEVKPQTADGSEKSAKSPISGK